MNTSQQQSDNPHASSPGGTKIKNITSNPITSSSASSSQLETAGDTKKKWPRPLDIFTWGVTNSPRLIGWNDEDFRKIVEEHRKRRMEDPSIPNMEETGFGLMGILANALKEAVYKKTDFDDLKSDLKKIEDSRSTTSTSVGGTPSSGSLSLSSQQKSSAEKSSKGRLKDSSSSIDIIGSSVNLKDMKVYKNVLSAIQYQRDAYIMGTEYAEKRKGEREKEVDNSQSLLNHGSSDSDTVEQSLHQTALQSQDHPIQSSSATSTTNGTVASAGISYKDYLDRYPNSVVRASSSLANTQLTALLTWFIPSQTMHNALLPMVLWTIAPPTPQLPEGGPLRKTINRSVCDLIPLSQGLLDGVMKDSILWVLSDESWRESVKGSSRNYLSYTDSGSSMMNGNDGGSSAVNNIHQQSTSSFGSHHGGSLSSSGGRVVITKTIRLSQ